ncbi:TNT domain-containing protein [Simiduia sp. 21SJ11W-1]|uniref:TNT domain-containing protein n=1 Tax=Simiduia sp. 21SJ11W-1 TaxID=2909669 RepID=UPI00209DE250|nr:TNT domain-containing protein [Simiduia sp. 21SJ11W-1]UTA46845.1 TNT domain-containing protein [Simiduia sp. 21SJ11W-1]
MGGGAAFEIILTAILAAVSGGVGAVASMGSKARHMTKFKKLGELLVDFAKASKQLAAHTKARAKQAAKAAKKSFDDLKTDMDAADRKSKSNSKNNNDNSVGFSYDSPRFVSYNDFKKSVKEFKSGGPDAERAYKLFQQENWKELESFFNKKGLNGGWPPNGGAISTKNISLKPPKKIDRFGGFIDEKSGEFRDAGTFTAGLNEPFENRALPDGTKNKILKKYIVKKEIPDVKAGKAIPWFGKKESECSTNFLRILRRWSKKGI